MAPSTVNEEYQHKNKKAIVWLQNTTFIDKQYKKMPFLTLQYKISASFNLLVANSLVEQGDLGLSGDGCNKILKNSNKNK